MNQAGASAPTDWFDWVLSSEEVVAGLLVLVLTVVLRVLWLLTTTVYQAAAEYFGRRLERCPLALGPLPVPPQRRDNLPDEVPVHCLIIRYGSDEYIEKLASDQERYEGRLRLEILTSKLRLDRENCTYSGTMPLKVHKRLGTQFNMFFEVEDDAAAARYAEALRGMDEIIDDVSISSYGPKPKVWFLLKRYHITNIADSGVRREGRGGIRNNFYFPI